MSALRVHWRLLFFHAAICLLLGGFASTSHGQLVVTGQETVTGTLVAVADGRVSIRDEAGKLHELKIQPPDRLGVALDGGALLRFAAEVEVTGSYPLDSLQEGEQIRLELGLNRRGDIQQPVSDIWRITAAGATTGLQTESEPSDARDFVPATLVGTVRRMVNNRLLVQVPQNTFTRKKTISVPLDEDAQVRLASNDHRTASAGAKVDRAVVAILNTGDRLIRSLKISMGQDSTARHDFDDQLALKHRHVPNEPLPPRLIRSRHFILQTDISEREAAVLLEKLERMVALMSAYFGRQPSGLIQGFVVRDLEQWPEGMLAEPAGIAKIKEGAGVCFSRRQGRRVEATVYSCDDHGVVQHECTHAFCTMTFGSTGPTWLAEGVAEMGQYWTSDEVAVNVDPVVIQYLRSAEPKKTLVEIAVPGNTAAGGWQDYAWRWALCHLLANNPNYSDRFKPLAIALMTGQPGASFAAAYGEVEQEIVFEYDQFLNVLDNGYDARLCAWQWGHRFVSLRPGRSASIDVLARYGWQASGVRVRAGQAYQVASTGEWRISAKGDALSADGDAEGNGRLIGVVLSDYTLSDSFELGTSATFTAPTDGDLYLRAREAWHALADNGGEVAVDIRQED